MERNTLQVNQANTVAYAPADRLGVVSGEVNRAYARTRARLNDPEAVTRRLRQGMAPGMPGGHQSKGGGEAQSEAETPTKPDTKS